MDSCSALFLTGKLFFGKPCLFVLRLWKLRVHKIFHAFKGCFVENEKVQRVKHSLTRQPKKPVTKGENRNLSGVMKILKFYLREIRDAQNRSEKSMRDRLSRRAPMEKTTSWLIVRRFFHSLPECFFDVSNYFAIMEYISSSEYW